MISYSACTSRPQNPNCVASAFRLETGWTSAERGLCFVVRALCLSWFKDHCSPEKMPSMGGECNPCNQSANHVAMDAVDETHTDS